MSESMELLLLCRVGFEKEVAAEATDLCAYHGVSGYVKAELGAGYARFLGFDESQLFRLVRQVGFRGLTFIRQWCVSPGLCRDLPTDDRVTPLVRVAQRLPSPGRLLVETLDTNEGKALGKLARGVGGHFERALKNLGRWQPDSSWQWHLTFVAGAAAFVGASVMGNAAHWPGGVPRLRLPRSAPSRATLKLEEAWHHFIPAEEWDNRLAYGMRAVDLGAAPGGWTWQLVNRSFWVDAVDNGPLAPALMESGLITHHRQDGFGFRPDKPVDWLVCDIADKPARVAALVGRWGASGYCREAVFNLKLPMKQRYQAVRQCGVAIEEALRKAGISGYQLRFKQLYHDREEVTGHLRLESRPRSGE